MLGDHNPRYPAESRPAGEYGPYADERGDRAVAEAAALPLDGVGRLVVVCPAPVHHPLELTRLRRLGAALRARRPGMALELAFRSRLADDAPFRAVPVDRLARLGEGGGPGEDAGAISSLLREPSRVGSDAVRRGSEEPGRRCAEGVGSGGAGLLLVGGELEQKAALRDIGGARLVGSLPLGYGPCDPGDPESERAADQLFAALAAASPEWRCDPEAVHPVFAAPASGTTAARSEHRPMTGFGAGEDTRFEGLADDPAAHPAHPYPASGQPFAEYAESSADQRHAHYGPSEPAGPPPFGDADGPRILIHQARFHAGDALWLTPLLAAIRGLWPRARTTVVGPPVAAELLAANPDAAEVVVYPEDGAAADRRRVLARLAGRWPDAALFAFARRPESAWLAEAAAAAGVGVRVNLEYFDPALDRLAPPPFTHEGRFFWGAQPSPRMLLYALAPLAGAGWEPRAAEGRVRLPLPPDAAHRAARRLGELGLAGRPLAVVAPGGRSSARWPAGRFAELAGRLAADGLAVLLTGAPDEEPELRDLAAAVPRPRVAAPVAVACDPLPVLGAWLASARLLVANDSGAIHLAEAAGTPTLYLAEPGKLVHSHPAGPGCLALFDHREPDPTAGALDGISVGQVAAAARHLYSPPAIV